MLETNRVVPTNFISRFFFSYDRREDNPGAFITGWPFACEDLLLEWTTIVSFRLRSKIAISAYMLERDMITASEKTRYKVANIYDEFRNNDLPITNNIIFLGTSTLIITHILNVLFFFRSKEIRLVINEIDCYLYL